MDRCMEMKENFLVFAQEFVKTFEHELNFISGVREGQKPNIKNSSLHKPNFAIEYIQKFISKSSDYKPGFLFGLDTKTIAEWTNTVIQQTYDYLKDQKVTAFARDCEKLLNRRNRDENEFKKQLIEGCFDIFYGYEMQMSILWSNVGQKEAFKMLARYSALRSIHWLRKNHNSTIGESICYGEYIDNIKLEFKYGAVNEKIDSNSFFTKPGISAVKDKITKYYVKDKNDINSYGFRRVFPWDDLTGEVYQMVPPLEKFSWYQYFLNTSDKKEYVEYVFNTMIHSNTETELIWFNVKPLGNVYTRTNTDISCEIFEMLTHDKAVVLVGLSGIGKTTMAIKCAKRYGRDLKSNVVWIDATDDSTIKQCIYKVSSNNLNINVKEDKEYLDINIIIDKIYDRVEPCLFVFDNARNVDSILDFLPLRKPELPRLMKFLITSTNSNDQDWLSDKFRFHQIMLKPFDDAESVVYMKKIIGITDNSQDECLKRLVGILENIPKALNLAANDIRIKKMDLSARNLKFDLSTYVDKLSPNIMVALDNILDSILKKVTMENHGHHALDMFNVITYMSCHQIPEDIFVGYLKNNDLDRQFEITKNLQRHSMLELEGPMLNTHELLQKINREKLRSESLETQVLNNILRYFLEIITNMDKDDKKDKQDNKLSLDEDLPKYIPHIVSLWNYAIEYDELVQEFIVSDIIGKKPHLSYFHLILGHSSYDVAKVLVSKIPKNNRQTIVNMKSHNTKKSSLHYAVESGCRKKVALLIENKAEINAKTKLKHTPLHLAARNNLVTIVDMLLDIGNIQINSLTTYEFTPLHYAAKFGNVEIIKKLLNNKDTDINSKTKFSFTPLHLSSENGHAKAVEALLEWEGLDIDSITNHDETPLFLAVKREHIEIVEILLENGADPNLGAKKKDDTIYTPLHEAVARNNLALVELLLENSRLRFDDFQSLLNFAESSESENVIEAIRVRI